MVTFGAYGGLGYEQSASGVGFLGCAEDRGGLKLGSVRNGIVAIDLDGLGGLGLELHSSTVTLEPLSVFVSEYERRARRHAGCCW